MAWTVAVFEQGATFEKKLSLNLFFQNIQIHLPVHYFISFADLQHYFSIFLHTQSDPRFPCKTKACSSKNVIIFRLGNIFEQENSFRLLKSVHKRFLCQTSCTEAGILLSSSDSLPFIEAPKSPRLALINFKDK